MASAAKADMGQSSSAASEGSQSQPPRAGRPEAAEDPQCPICLGPMKRPAYVTYCMHKFCLRCIRQWAKSRDNCPTVKNHICVIDRIQRGFDGILQQVGVHESFTI
uniref:RING-type E3 ubiquitin transferase n=1 Tax=Cyanistes caeruleus TaxID=156563 RepID=A0A8C0USB5_CYACU